MDTGSLEEDPFFPDFLASCPSTNGPPASKKVRARDGETCAPNGQASLSIDSFPDSVLGIFGSPSDREQKLQGAAAAAAGVTKNNGPPCDYFDVEHPFHLCCASEGMPSNTLLPKRPNTGWLGHIGAFLRQDVYINMEDCQSGTYYVIVSFFLRLFSFFPKVPTEEPSDQLIKIRNSLKTANILPCTAPRAFEVCCQSVSRANDPDALIQGVEQIFNREKPQSLEEFLRKVDEVYGDGQTWLTGEFCYPAGISNR